MVPYKYVIIGGGIAGGKAVEGIRQVDQEGSVILISQEDHRPYERPPLSKGYLRAEADLSRVYLRDRGYYDENDIETVAGFTVTQIKPGEKEVYLEDGTVLGYEKLLLATGGRAIRLEMPGSDLDNVFTLRTIKDSDAIRAAAGEGKTALVMGGSFIGTEVAASLSQIGTEIIQVFPESRLLERIVPPKVSEYLNDLFERHGVRVLPGTVADSLSGEGKVESAALNNGETPQVDLVVMGVGIRLNTKLARAAGLALREDDQAVLVDQSLRTSDGNIFAAGDIAAWPDETFDQRLRVEHWDVARRQGRHAGCAMAGEVEAYTAMPYFFSDIFDLSFEVWGNLSSWDRTVIRGSLQEDSFAVYYFDGERLTGVLAVDRPDGERKPMQALVKARPGYEEIAADLEDTGTDLAELAGTESKSEAQASDEETLSFADDIAPMFREKDVEEMKEISGFDLSDYDDVSSRASHIYERLKDESMPCDGPWPEEQIEKYKRWIDQGKQP